MSNATCSIIDGGSPCPNRVLARGMCSKHYERWSKYGDPLFVGKMGRPKGPVRECSEDDCHGHVCARGLCEKHYRRWQKSGDPQFTKRILDDIEARFLSYVNKDGPVPPHRAELGQCWVWTGTLNEGDHHGYGHFGVGQKVVLAHRWSYEHFTRALTKDKPHLDHLCRNHACVRPSHLDPVTNRENSLRGDNTKLSDEVVAVLYARWRAGEKSVDLAAEVGTHRTNLLKRFRRVTDEAA